MTPPGRGRRGRVRRLPCGEDAGSPARRRGRDRAAQPHRLLPVPAAAARGGGRHPRAAPDHCLRWPGRCPGVRVVLGEADHVDLQDRWVGFTPDPRGTRPGWLRPAGARRGQRQQAAAHPGGDRVRARLPRHARGALPARPHRPPDRAGRAAEDPAEQQARCTFVVVGAGYTGTEVAAHGRAVHRRAARAAAPLAGTPAAGCCSTPPPGCCPSSTSGCRGTADKVLRERGVDVRMGTSVGEATADGVQPHRRRVRADPHAGVVRRGAPRPAGRRAGPAHRAGAAGRSTSS